MNEDTIEKPIRAMLVEDDAESAAAIRIMLEKRGFPAVVCSTAEEALRRFADLKFDVIVADIRLPGMSGVELLRSIRAKQPDFPVILLTGYDSIESAVQAVRLGAHDYILKPLNVIEDLIAPVEKAVRGHRLLIRNRALEESLRQSEARFRIVLENSVDIIFRLNLQTRNFDYVSPSARSILDCPDPGLRAPDVDSFIKLVHPDDAEALRSLIATFAAAESDGEIRQPVECRARRGAGEDVWLSVTCRTVADASGRVVAVVGNARDITGRKQAEAREREVRETMARAERMQTVSLMAAGVAHDLNNVMMDIVVLPDLIRMKLRSSDRFDKDPDGVQTDLVQIRDSAQTVSNIFRDLLTVSHSGHFRVGALDINGVIEEYLGSLDFASLQNANPEVKIRTDLDEDVAVIAGSNTQLRRVIMNLSVNAMDAMPEGGTLAIRTGNISLKDKLAAYEIIEPGEYVTLRVADTGSGIESEALGRIFEPFFSRKMLGRRSGSGIGLSVVHGVVKAHNGFVDVKSELGRGTTFTLYFPAAPGGFVVEDVPGRGAAFSAQVPVLAGGFGDSAVRMEEQSSTVVTKQ